MKVIIHAPTGAALKRARRNLANLLASAPSVEVELVINAEAVKAALADPDPSTHDYLVVCENSLNAAGLDLPAGMRTTPAAVHHICQRQSDGWSYFRA